MANQIVTTINDSRKTKPNINPKVIRPNIHVAAQKTINLNEMPTVRTRQNRVDSFTLGHVTLGRLRSSLNYEADCSTNNNYGTWNGTGIDGSQYNTGGQRLSTGVFNGSDNYIESNGTISELDGTGDFSISVRINIDAGSTDNTIFHHNIGGDRVAIHYQSGTLRAGVNNGLSWVDSKSITASTGSWINVRVTYDQSITTLTLVVDGVTATGANDPRTSGTTKLLVGSLTSGTYHFDGKIDEVMVFDTILSSENFDDIEANTFDGNHSKYSNCVLWWSMDNPRLGNRKGDEEFVSVSNPNNFFVDRFRFGTFTDTDNTDAIVDTTVDYRIEFAGDDTYQSLPVYLGGSNVQTVTFGADITGAVQVDVTADGGDNWQTINIDTQTTILNQGLDLRYRVTETGSTSATVSNVRIRYTK